MDKENDFKVGTWVGFTPESGNPDTGKNHEIDAKEKHNGLTFYRLKGMPGALFVAASLYA